MGLRSRKECIPIKYISKNNFPSKGIQIYHTSALKEEIIDCNKVRQKMDKMIMFKKDVMLYAHKNKNMVKAATKVNMQQKDG